jgi:hypothetical protein
MYHVYEKVKILIWNQACQELTEDIGYRNYWITWLQSVHNCGFVKL